jgi:pilus assembly protein CpaB
MRAMKRAQILALAVAGVAGLGAAYFVSGLINQPPPVVLEKKEEIKTTQVLVAATDIAVGQTVTDGSFRWINWPSEAAARGYITRDNGGDAKKRELAGSIARSALLANEPITTSKLIKAGSGGVLAAILPPGMRATSIKIDEKTAVGRMILPNDHVDVLLTSRSRSRNGTGEEISTEVLFRNIRILAIGQTMEVKDGKRTSEGNVATLELSPGQAEMLAQASVRGEVSLVLRSIADISSSELGADDRAKERGNSIRVLRYGVRSKAYSVN